jgi:hypothetical protein
MIVAPRTWQVMGIADGGQFLVTDTVRNLVAGEDYRFSDYGSHDLKASRNRRGCSR